jgi:hypothetical protein
MAEEEGIFGKKNSWILLRNSIKGLIEIFYLQY